MDLLGGKESPLSWQRRQRPTFEFPSFLPSVSLAPVTPFLSLFFAPFVFSFPPAVVAFQLSSFQCTATDNQPG